MRALISAVIVDDEPPARRRLRRLLEEHDVPVAGEAGSGMEALELIDRLKPELLILDISMPGMNGLEVMQRIGVRDGMHVILVTAHDDRALAAYEAQALDYLVKPVHPDRFARSIARVKRLMGAYPKQLHLNDDMVPVPTILCLEAARNYVVVHAAGTHIVRASLESMSSKLDPTQFLRISRSHVVNASAIRTLEPLGHGERRVVLADGSEMVWTRRYRDNLAAYLSRTTSR